MASGGTLTYDEARAFYDRFGSKQDWQRFYEDAAVNELLEHMAFDHAARVVEFGCGTGRLAEHLLQDYLPEGAQYRGVDVSATMVALTRRRLARCGDRVRIVQNDGTPLVPEASTSCDRFLATYVLDLLSRSDINALLDEAARVLQVGGRLGLVSLSHGATRPARLVERIWNRVYRSHPSWVGGCRPISVREFIGSGWRLRHRAAVTRWMITSEILVAEKLDEATA